MARRMFTSSFIGLLINVATLIGMLLLIIPGVIVHARWFIAIPIYVIEQVPVKVALFRSKEMTTGRLLCVTLVAFATQPLSITLYRSLLPGFGDRFDLFGLLPPTQPIEAAGGLILSALFYSIGMVGTYAAYNELKRV